MRLHAEDRPSIYKLTADNKEIKADDKVVLEVLAGTATQNANLVFELTKANVEQAGEYEGHVTYTASVVDQ